MISSHAACENLGNFVFGKLILFSNIFFPIFSHTQIFVFTFAHIQHFWVFHAILSTFHKYILAIFFLKKQSHQEKTLYFSQNLTVGAARGDNAVKHSTFVSCSLNLVNSGTATWKNRHSFVHRKIYLVANPTLVSTTTPFNNITQSWKTTKNCSAQETHTVNQSVNWHKGNIFTGGCDVVPGYVQKYFSTRVCITDLWNRTTLFCWKMVLGGAGRKRTGCLALWSRKV